MAAIGLPLFYQNADRIAFGTATGPKTFVGSLFDGEVAQPGNGVHVANLANTRAAVDAFYAAALANGASAKGKPGLRPQYHPNYYGAYVRDPDGNRLHAVCLSSSG